MMVSTPQPPPEWASADAYLFDIDGTLLNTRDAVQYFAFRNAVRHYFGIEGSIEGVHVHGNTDIGILRAVLRRAGIADAEFEAKLPHLVTSMCEEVIQNAKDIRVELCPSVRDLLLRLHQGGKLMGIVSGNLEAIGWAKVQAAGLRDYFAFGSFSDRRELRETIFQYGIDEAKRRLGANASVIVIGDTPSDVAAAKKVGVPIVSVATGIYPREELHALRPDYCVSCCTELL